MAYARGFQTSTTTEKTLVSAFLAKSEALKKMRETAAHFNLAPTSSQATAATTTTNASEPKVSTGTALIAEIDKANSCADVHNAIVKFDSQSTLKPVFNFAVSTVKKIGLFITSIADNQAEFSLNLIRFKDELTEYMQRHQLSLPTSVSSKGYGATS